MQALGRMAEDEASKRALVEEWTGQFPEIIGRILAEKGEVDPALNLLEAAVDAGLGGRIDPVDRAFDSLRDRPRWNAVLERLGKSPAQLDAIEFEVPRLLRTRDRTARFVKCQRRQNGGALPFNWRRQGGIGRDSGSCGPQPASRAALARLWILLEIGETGVYTSYYRSGCMPLDKMLGARTRGNRRHLRSGGIRA